MLLSIALQVTNTVVDSISQRTSLPKMPTTEATGTLWQSIEKGGIIMIPLAILFIVAIYIFIERFLTIRYSTRKEGNFIQDIKQLIEEKKIPEAIALCQKTDSPLGRMVEKGINRIGKPIKEIEESIEVEGRFEVFDLEKGLPILSAIAGIAPMLGFLGTILGVIKIFSDIAISNDVSIGTVSAGLYVKMISSAAGLLVGITAYFFYNWLNVKIGKIINKMERNAIGFIDFLKDIEDDKTEK
ncbi:MAG: MotA/TolQ/ExbB proton channel family protein [Paludibacteraceae bacterium]